MLKQLFDVILEAIEINSKKNSAVDDKLIEMVEELEELEVQYVEALAYAERWGDLSDSSDFRTVEVNKFKRLIQSKERMIETLKNTK